MERQNNSDGGFRYSLKKLFLLWLPAAFIFSVFISLIFIFKASTIPYVNSLFSPGNKSLWEIVANIFTDAGGASPAFIIIAFLCSLAHFFIAEIFCLIRAFKLKKREESGIFTLLFRLVITQGIGAGALLFSFLLMLVIPLAISFTYGYYDLKTSVTEAANESITHNEEIIKLIQNASSIIEVYDSAGSFGAVLAKRGLKKKGELTIYEGAILPLLVKIAGKDAEGRSFFLPSAQSIVYTDFSKDTAGKIMTELAFNHLRHHENPAASSIVQKMKKPPITFLDDQAYAPYLKKKQNEIDQKSLNDFKNTISSNEKIVAKCKAIDASNAKLLDGQESDYQKNCVLKVHYSNCAEFRQKIDKNKEIAQEAAAQCQKNKAMLAPQYKQFEERKADSEKEASSILEKQKRESTNGMYFPNLQSVYVRVVPDQNAFVYLSILIHELLHHYSKGGSELPVFINEGMTDYLTLKSLKLNDYEIVGASGYFKEVQTIMALQEKIPESELFTAYFTDSPAMLEASFKKYFPEADYPIFLNKGETMYLETFDAINPTFTLGFWDTDVDHPSVQDLRTFLGLEPKKFSD